MVFKTTINLDVAVSQGFSKYQALGLFKNDVDKIRWVGSPRRALEGSP